MDWKVFHEERRCRKERPPPSLQHNTAGLSRTEDQTIAATPAHIHFTSTWPWPFLPARGHQNNQWLPVHQNDRRTPDDFFLIGLAKKGKNLKKTTNKNKSKKQRERSVCVRQSSGRLQSGALIWCRRSRGDDSDRESEGDGVLMRRPIRFQARRLDLVGSKTPDILFLLTAWFLYHQNHTGPQCWSRQISLQTPQFY